jgi:hypothetical protein
MTERLFKQVDGAGLAAFRVAFGVLMLVSTVRFQLMGWVDEFFVKPTFFFKYPGFEWVPALPGPWMHALFVALAVLSAMIAAGLFYRVAIVLFFVGFTWVELIDATNYLNHYYLVSLLALIMCFLPLHRVWSVDAWRKPAIATTHLPAWCTYLLRVQVGIVYFYAGLAKLGTDWLLHAQPLNIWLSSRTSTPIIGGMLDQPAVHFAMAWGGFLFDTTIVLFLSLRRTRPFAYAVVLFFHLMTHLLFPIGMFPFIMVVAALVFFSPSWPRKLLRREALPDKEGTGKLSRVFAGVAVAYCALQIAMPLRHRLYGGNVLWHEEGMRWSWKVMVREKNASITYFVEDRASGRVWHVSPRKYLDDRQLREFSGQPEMILQLGRHIADDWKKKGFADVKVRVEALVSFNGRPPALLVDPEVDLLKLEGGHRWVLPAPTTTPIQLKPV